MSRGGGAPYPRYCNAQGTAGPSFTCELLFPHYSSKEWLGSTLLTILLGSGTSPSNEQRGGGHHTPVTATRKGPRVPALHAGSFSQTTPARSGWGAHYSPYSLAAGQVPSMSRGGGGAYPRYCNAQGTAGPSTAQRISFPVPLKGFVPGTAQRISQSQNLSALWPLSSQGIDCP